MVSKRKLSAPITIYGGKHYMLKHLLPLIPEHTTYVECFGGAGRLLFAKEPSPVEVYNDVDSDLVNFFQVLRDKTAFDAFHRMCLATPYSREEFYACRERRGNEQNAVERAWRFFVCARMAFSGRYKSPSWAFGIATSRRGMDLHVSSWISSVEGLPDVHSRLLRVLVEHNDFRKVLETYDRPETFFYLDPPYVQSSRKGKDRYPFELTDDDHSDLVRMLLQLRGKVILSGYDNDIYRQLEEHGWKRQQFSVMSTAVAKTKQTGLLGEGAVKDTQKRLEVVWASPNCETVA